MLMKLKFENTIKIQEFKCDIIRGFGSIVFYLGGLMQLSDDNINQNENWPKLVIIKAKQLDYKST